MAWRFCLFCCILCEVNGEGDGKVRINSGTSPIILRLKIKLHGKGAHDRDMTVGLNHLGMV